MAGPRVDRRVQSAYGASEPWVPPGQGRKRSWGLKQRRGKEDPRLRVPWLSAGLHEISEASPLCQLTWGGEGL